MKKSLLLITLLLITTTLFAQSPTGTEWKIVNNADLGITDASMAIKPGRFLDGGRIIWLVGHSTSGTYSANSFRSTDFGETWLKGTHPTPSITGNGVRIANIDAIDANIAFMAFVNGTIHKTTDGGVTWRQVHSYTAGGNEWFGGLKVLNNNVVVAVGDGAVAGEYYLARSTDAGETWTRVPHLTDASAQWAVFTYGTAMDAYGDNVWMALYQGTGDQQFPIVKSTDGGATWSVASRITSPASRIWGISFATPNVGMAVNQRGCIYLTTNGGSSWDSLTTQPPTGFSVRNVTAVKDRNKFFVVGEFDNAVTGNRTPVIYSTTDNGSTWVKNFVPLPSIRGTADNFSLQVYDDNLGFASYRNNLVYKIGKPEVKKNFHAATEANTSGLVYKPGAILNNGNTIWFCGHEVASRNTYSFVSTDGGTTFRTGSMVTGRTSNIVAYNATTALMATADGRIIRTTDGGTTWTAVFTVSGGFFNGIQLVGPDVVIAYGDGTTAGNPYFCKSTDRGLTFAAIPRSELPTDLGVTLYGYQGHGTCSDSYGSHAWFTLYGATATASYLAKTSDNGTTWTSVDMSITGTSGSNGRIRSISFPTERYGMAVNLIGEIFLTENSGNLWVKVNTPNYPTDSLFVYNVTGIPETRTFIAGGVIISKANPINKYYGTFITYDLGQTWTKIAAPNSGQFTGAFSSQAPGTTNFNDHIQGGLYLNENFGYALSHAGKVLKLGDGPVISVPDDLKDIINVPKDYVLEQNYPNPFNPSTTIKFKLNKTEYVRLVIYDALGKEIRTLLDNNILPGDYSLVFNAQGLSSGVYFYTLKVGNAIETKKMVLMK